MNQHPQLQQDCPGNSRKQTGYHQAPLVPAQDHSLEKDN
jgi:hypothetical protein